MSLRGYEKKCSNQNFVADILKLVLPIAVNRKNYNLRRYKDTIENIFQPSCSERSLFIYSMSRGYITLYVREQSPQNEALLL